MMKMKAIILSLSCLIACNACGQQAWPEAKITLRVVDEIGNPVVGADAGVGFSYLGPSGRPGDYKSERQRGNSDENGYLTLSMRTRSQIGYGATKPGYYRTGGLMYRFSDKQFGRWEPWNPILQIVLKKMKNPISMYVRSVDIELPKLEEPIGFDLIVSDWVAPFGKGTKSDLVFKLKKDMVDWKEIDTTLTVSFSNQGDGLIPFEQNPIVGSELMSAHYAPENGYLGEWKLRIANSQAMEIRDLSGQKREERHYYFRVRTFQDQNGIESALYGKIYADFEFIPFDSDTARIRFLYYLNPNGTRNVEFDPNSNLFEELGQERVVRRP